MLGVRNEYTTGMSSPCSLRQPNCGTYSLILTLPWHDQSITLPSPVKRKSGGAKEISFLQPASGMPLFAQDPLSSKQFSMENLKQVSDIGAAVFLKQNVTFWTVSASGHYSRNSALILPQVVGLPH